MASSGVGGRGDGNHGNKETRSQFEPADEQHELLSKPGYFKFMAYFPKRYIVGIMAFFGFCKSIGPHRSSEK